MISEIDKHFMRMALREARKAIGRTSPNPCVGSVVVRDGEVLGKGYHQKAGTPHAEIHALRQASAKCRGATLYVTLEPCSHTGRTPPCCEAVVASGIARVVIGMEDPNPLVQGAGIRHLQENGISVTTGVLEPTCRELNRPFIKYITSGLPWVIMKAGLSLDGKITYQGRKTGGITGRESRAAVHRLRDRCDAIMVGIGTVVSDDPSLTTRLPGRKKGKDPVRVVLDTGLSIPEHARILLQQSAAPTLVFCGPDADAEKAARLENRGTVICRVDKDAGGGVDLSLVLRELGERGITSVLVEGGARVHGAILKRRLYDYAYLFYAPLFAGDQGLSFLSGYDSAGGDSAFRLAEVRSRRYGADLLISGCLDYR
jgi:diaminohydroxyphosphoribosylaminopyrimidine deaminase/5-amino-6-(5-phosphoribosylamino)uracil reductase